MNGGKAGKPFCVTVDVEGTPRDLGGLVDGEPVLAGQVVRVVTTGGGGWGDPLEREPELVARDVIDGKVSLAAAREEYGVALIETASGGEFDIDVGATDTLRSTLRARSCPWSCSMATASRPRANSPTNAQPSSDAPSS